MVTTTTPVTISKLAKYKILRISDIQNHIKVEMINRLCSVYGRVIGAKLFRRDRRSECYVEFGSHETAMLVNDMLDDANLFGCLASTSLSKYLNLQEVELFEKGKIVSEASHQESLNFSTEASSQGSIGSPLLHRKVQPEKPSKFLEVLIWSESTKSDLKQLLNAENWVIDENQNPERLVFEFQTVEAAVSAVCLFNGHFFNGNE